MNTAYTTTQFHLGEPARCVASVSDGSAFVAIIVGRHSDHAITLSGPPDVVLAQLDAMRQEVGRVTAEAEGVTA